MLIWVLTLTKHSSLDLAMSPQSDGVSTTVLAWSSQAKFISSVLDNLFYPSLSTLKCVPIQSPLPKACKAFCLDVSKELCVTCGRLTTVRRELVCCETSGAPQLPNWRPRNVRHLNLWNTALVFWDARVGASTSRMKTTKVDTVTNGWWLLLSTTNI